MKYLSLFSGIGGFELGIQQAYEQKNSGLVDKGGQMDTVSGGQETLNGSRVGDTHAEQSSDEPDQSIPICIGYSEIDKYAIQIYQKHFPEHKNYGDIKLVRPYNLPDFDLLCGGFPCQAFSIAGKRAGFADTRGTLFFEIARILKEKRPRLLLLENVKGLLSHDGGRTFKIILATLTELGYDLQWQVLNSKNFGVPQNRERVFIVGHLRGTPRPQVFPIGEATTGDIKIKSKATHQQDIVYGSDGIMGALSAGTHLNAQFRTNILQLNNPKHSNDRVYDTEGISPTLNTIQGGMRQPFIAKTVRTGGRASPHGSKQNWDSYEFEGKIRRLTPTECERLQGFRMGWTEGISDSQRYKVCGNAVTVNVIRAIIEKLCH